MKKSRQNISTNVFLFNWLQQLYERCKSTRSNEKLCFIQLINVRIWLSLFFFLLNVVIINAYIICRSTWNHKKEKIHISQRLFRMRFVWNLIIAKTRELNETWIKRLIIENFVKSRFQKRYRSNVTSKKNTTKTRFDDYVNKNFEFFSIRFASNFHEKRRYYDKEKNCTYCKYQRSVFQLKIKKKCSKFDCSICDFKYFICFFCFHQWHQVH